MPQEVIDLIVNYTWGEPNWADNEDVDYDIHEFHVGFESYFNNLLVDKLIGTNDYWFDFDILSHFEGGNEYKDIFYTQMYNAMGEAVRIIRERG